MRPNQQNNNKQRSRGRNNNNNNQRRGGGGNPLSRNYESNGPDVKIRGNAAHIAEKYVQLARDATSVGDNVMAENYLQHAEHYFRIILAAQAQYQPRQDQAVDTGAEEDEDTESVSPAAVRSPAGNAPETGDAEGQEAEQADAGAAREPRRPRQRRPRRERIEETPEAATPVEARSGDGEVPANGAAADAAEEAPKRPRRTRRTTKKDDAAEDGGGGLPAFLTAGREAAAE